MLKLKNQISATIPATWSCEVFLDSADNLLKVRKDNWVIELLELSDTNALKLEWQLFQWGVAINDPVYFNTWTNLWTKATDSTQSPAWVRWSIAWEVILWWFYTTSWLTPWAVYYMQSTWGIWETQTNTKIWTALSSTQLYIDIDVEDSSGVVL